MADFDTQIRESQAEVAKAQARISEITTRIEAARSKLDAGAAGIDIETATLTDVAKQADQMNANIAELIKSGHPQKQAEAIALSEARKSRRKLSLRSQCQPKQ